MPDLNSIFLQYGPLGVIIIVQAWVIMMLWKENKEHTARYNELQEKRYQEALNISDKVTGPLSEQKELSQKIYNLIEAMINREGKGK